MESRLAFNEESTAASKSVSVRQIRGTYNKARTRSLFIRSCPHTNYLFSRIKKLAQRSPYQLIEGMHKKRAVTQSILTIRLHMLLSGLEISCGAVCAASVGSYFEGGGR